jgi:hypothetical protein
MAGSWLIEHEHVHYPVPRPLTLSLYIYYWLVVFFSVFGCFFNCNVIFKIINRLKVNNDNFKLNDNFKRHVTVGRTLKKH